MKTNNMLTEFETGTRKWWSTSVYHLHGPDAAEAFVLRVQHDHALLHHHTHFSARFLHPEQLRREGVDGHHDAVVHDCLSDAGRREHASNVRRSAARR